MYFFVIKLTYFKIECSIIQCKILFNFNLGQLETLQDELFKKRTECMKLQQRLDGTTESLRKIVECEKTTSALTEDKELNQAMDAQKAINR